MADDLSVLQGRKTSETETTEPNPFDCFDETAAVLAFCFTSFGEAGLRYLLENIGPEGLERDISELEAVGLPHVAAIVAEFAAEVPEPECPFPESDAANRRDWFRRHKGIWQGYLKTDDTAAVD